MCGPSFDKHPTSSFTVAPLERAAFVLLQALTNLITGPSGICTSCARWNVMAVESIGHKASGAANARESKSPIRCADTLREVIDDSRSISGLGNAHSRSPQDSWT